MIKKIFVDFVAANLSTDKRLHNQMLTYRCFLVIS